MARLGSHAQPKFCQVATDTHNIRKSYHSNKPFRYQQSLISHHCQSNPDGYRTWNTIPTLTILYYPVTVRLNDTRHIKVSESRVLARPLAYVESAVTGL